MAKKLSKNKNVSSELAAGALTPVAMGDLTPGGILNAGDWLAANDGGSGGDTEGKTMPDITAYATQKAPVTACTTAALPTCVYSNGTSGVGATLTASANGAFPTVDGQTISASQRIMVNNQASSFQNGIYTLTNAGSVSTTWVLTRATDLNTGAQFNGSVLVYVFFGTVYAGTTIQFEPNGSVVVGSSAIQFYLLLASPYLPLSSAPNGNYTTTATDVGFMKIVNNCDILTLDPAIFPIGGVMGILNGNTIDFSPMAVTGASGALITAPPGFTGIYSNEIWYAYFFGSNQFILMPGFPLQGNRTISSNIIDATIEAPSVLVQHTDPNYQTYGLKFYFTSVQVACITATSVTGQPNFSIGTNATNYDNVVADAPTVGFTTAGTSYSLELRNPRPYLNTLIPDNSDLVLNISTPATATAMTIRVDIQGYYAP